MKNHTFDQFQEVASVSYCCTQKTKNKNRSCERHINNWHMDIN